MRFNSISKESNEYKVFENEGAVAAVAAATTVFGSNTKQIVIIYLVIHYTYKEG
jgi:hypothetical protein